MSLMTRLLARGFDGDMLISKVTYSLSAQGSVTTLQVAPPHTFDGNPTPPKKSPT